MGQIGTSVLQNAGQVERTFRSRIALSVLGARTHTEPTAKSSHNDSDHRSSTFDHVVPAANTANMVNQRLQYRRRNPYVCHIPIIAT